MLLLLSCPVLIHSWFEVYTVTNQSNPIKQQPQPRNISPRMSKQTNANESAFAKLAKAIEAKTSIIRRISRLEQLTLRRRKTEPAVVFG